MAGTDRRRGEKGVLDPDRQPVIVLVAPQLGENVGTAARAMLNCGLARLRLVAPRDGWPSPKAVSAASGADIVLERAELFDTAEAAVADLSRVYATTARPRELRLPVLTPREAAARMAASPATVPLTGVLFGPERRGLTNDDIALADAVIEAPLNPGYASLNLAQAVLLLAYEWRLALHSRPAERRPGSMAKPAARQDLLNFFEHLEAELDACGFLYPPEKRPVMVRNIRAMFQRAGLTDQEVRTLRGIVAGLTRGKDLKTKDS